MRFLVESAGDTHVGKVRQRNEDAFFIDAKLGLYVVCDGMGGHLGGQVASRTAVDTIVEQIRSGAVGNSEPLVAAIRQASAVVHRKAQTDSSLRNMGTTVIAIRRDGDQLQVCHVGDSRIYRLRRGRLEQITRDHNLGNLWQDNPQQASRFGAADPNSLVRAVGLREEVQVEHQRHPLTHGDLYLLCCDGLTDMVDDWILRELLSDALRNPLEECVHALIRAALGNGGVDNTTVILLRVTSGP